mgnify:CR=1 FL=1
MIEIDVFVDPDAVAFALEDGMRAFADLMGYMDDLVTTKEADSSGDDVLSRLVRRRGEPGLGRSAERGAGKAGLRTRRARGSPCL